MDAGDTEREGALAGLKVVDLSDESGRMAGKLLAELGADVVRLRPGQPGPAMVDAPGGVLDWWFDGGTTSVPLDLDAGDDRARFLALVAVADVLIETEAPGRLAALGLGPDRLAEVNPRLTHVSLTPYGLDGPRAHWQSSDLVAAAAGMILSVNGEADEPVAIWGRQMHNIAGFYAAISALAGVARRRATGRGMHVDLSQQHAIASCSEHILMFWWWPELLGFLGAPVAQRQGSLHWVRAYEVVPCKTGYVMISPSAGGVPELFRWMAEEGHPAKFPDEPNPYANPANIPIMMEAIHEFALDPRRPRAVPRRPGAPRPLRPGPHHPRGGRVPAAHRPRVLPPGGRRPRRRAPPRAAGPVVRHAGGATAPPARGADRGRQRPRPLGHRRPLPVPGPTPTATVTPPPYPSPACGSSTSPTSSPVPSPRVSWPTSAPRW